MSRILVDENLLLSSLDKVVVITGGANGIGRATVSRFYQAGAHVFFSDINTLAGEALAETLTKNESSSNGTCHFTTVDVCDYNALLNLFEVAYSKYGRVDIAVYSAGITEKPGWVVSEDIDLESVKQYPKPLMEVLDVNLNGCLYFTRIALAFLKEGAPSSPENLPTRSLTLVSSAQAFQEGPGLCGYSTSKHGMLGLMRSLRLLAPKIYNVRVNVICPWATDTAMIATHVHLFRDNGIPLNTPDDVGQIIQMVSLDAGCNGKAVYVGGGKGFDIEEGLARTLPEWLGKENAEGWKLQDEVFAKVRASLHSKPFKTRPRNSHSRRWIG